MKLQNDRTTESPPRDVWIASTDDDRYDATAETPLLAAALLADELDAALTDARRREGRR